MNLAATVKAMAAAGCSAEQIATVVEAIDEERRAKARAGNAERQRRYRENHNANNGVTQRDSALQAVIKRDEPLHAVTDGSSDDASRARVLYAENNIYIPPNNPTDYTPTTVERVTPVTASPRKSKRVAIDERVSEILIAGGLSERTARDVIEHRRSRGAKLTERAAELLVRKFAAFSGGCEAAAETMIAQGWQGFDPAWIRPAIPRSGASAGPSAPFTAPFQRRPELSEAEKLEMSRRFHEAVGSTT